MTGMSQGKQELCGGPVVSALEFTQINCCSLCSIVANVDALANVIGEIRFHCETAVTVAGSSLRYSPCMRIRTSSSADV